MKIPIIKYINKKIFNYYTGLSFFIWILIYKGDRTKTLINKSIRHEKIHYYQQLELGFIFALLVWAFLMIRSLIKHGKGAYRNHPWEREAYDNEWKLDYLDNRKPFAWIKYWNENTI